MRKNKSKFDVKEFFVNHGEKIVLVLILPLALWVATWAMGYPPLSWKPEDLMKSANDARQRIEENDRTAADEKVSVFEYQLYAQQIKKPVETRYYRTPTVWNPSVFQELHPRGKPQVLTVHSLRARPGIGAIFVRPKTTLTGGVPTFNLTAPTGSGQNQPDKDGKRWIVVTGLIPIREQLKIYLDLFPSAKGFQPGRDWPYYAKYDVERCEETATGRSEWKKLDVARTYKEEVVNKWVAAMPELVDPAYLAPQILPNFPPMAYPLPPLAKKKFGNEITQPSIPMLAESFKEDQEVTQRRMEELRKKWEAYDPNKVDEYDPFQRQPGSGMGRGMNGPGGMGMTGANEMYGTSGAMGTEHQFEEDSVKTTDYLFRFFDFDVEEGKTYRYRVQLELLNPNYKVNPGNLESADLASDRYLATDFSTESNSATLGSDARVLAVSTTAPRFRSPWIEPAATIMTVQFDMDSGNEWYLEKETVRRGSVADFLRATVTSSVLPTGTGASGSDYSLSPPPPRSTTRPAARPTARAGRTPPGRPVPGSVEAGGSNLLVPETKDGVDVRSGICVVDIAGGFDLQAATERGGNDQLRTTGKIMLMEPNGTLVIHSVAEDFEETYRYKNPGTDTSSFTPGSGMMGRMGM